MGKAAATNLMTTPKNNQKITVNYITSLARGYSTNAILCHDCVEILQIFTNILQFKGIGMTYFGYKFGCELVEIGLTMMANAKK